MGRMIIVEAANQHGVSCLPAWRPMEYYNEKYKVVAVINKSHNPYYVGLIKEYFKKKGVTINGK